MTAPVPPPDQDEERVCPDKACNAMDAVGCRYPGAHVRMPKPPEGFAACRVGYNPQVTHLVILDSKGRNDGRPTLCRLTRFDTRGSGGERLLPADLPGWSMGGGVEGPGVIQVECPACYQRLGQLRSLNRLDAPTSPAADKETT